MMKLMVNTWTFHRSPVSEVIETRGIEFCGWNRPSAVLSLHVLASSADVSRKSVRLHIGTIHPSVEEV